MLAVDKKAGMGAGECEATKMEIERTGHQNHFFLFLVLMPVTHESPPPVNLRDLETSQLHSARTS